MANFNQIWSIIHGLRPSHPISQPFSYWRHRMNNSDTIYTKPSTIPMPYYWIRNIMQLRMLIKLEPAYNELKRKMNWSIKSFNKCFWVFCAFHFEIEIIILFNILSWISSKISKKRGHYRQPNSNKSTEKYTDIYGTVIWKWSWIKSESQASESRNFARADREREGR